MEPLVIEATFATPSVKFYPDGNLYIGGRSLPENSVKFYGPVFEWIRSFKGKFISLEVRFDYLNTASSKQVYDLFMILKENTSVQKVNVNWYYEEGDEECYEFGRELEGLTSLDFEYHEYEESL
jgi:hypothetical protein